ncbi:hypothetical protein SAMN02745866_03679 [Alteromonadaceae bacterium Bs31]|nr:hypothetical protein SAMN02745866_03679 [Alteromonadaceae bacterium Bs31]
MRDFRILMLLVTFALCSKESFAADQGRAIGKVLRVWAHTEHYNPYSENTGGLFLAEIEGLPSPCGNENQVPRFAIRSSHPSYNTVVSMVLAAQASGKLVQIEYLKSCTLRGNAWDFGYLVLLP